MSLLKVLVLALVVSAVMATDVDAERPARKPKKSNRKLVSPTVLSPKHIMKKQDVVIVPKGDPRARPPTVAGAPSSPLSGGVTPARPVLKDGAPASPKCAAAKGTCIPKASCKAPNLIKTGLCPGATYCCTLPPPPPPPLPVSIAALSRIADSSQCSKRNWADRGVMPPQFLRGMAASYAKAVCNPTRADVVFVGNSQTGSNDALAWYGSILKSALGPASSGLTTVRQLYTLLVGLGMRESSGKYCVGRDRSASFTSHDTAEAGLFQTSYGPHKLSSHLDNLFANYRASPVGCLKDPFTTGLSCSSKDLENFGKPGEIGLAWQQVTKACPAFAVEYAAVLLRLNGGSKGEWGPLRTKKAEVVKDCYDMFGNVLSYVAQNPSICDKLL
jgi:hypothetical protein